MICGTFFPFDTQLRDEREIHVREANAQDTELFVKGFEQLSKRSRKLRFLSPHNALTKQDIERFVRDNTVDHVAIGAVVGDTSPVAVARYVRMAGQPEVAEFALTVIDEFQKLGIGTLLLGSLARCAVSHGIMQFDGLIHPENRAMMNLLESLGATIPQLTSEGIIVSLPLFKTANDYPVNAAGNRFREAYRLCDLSASQAGSSSR